MELLLNLVWLFVAVLAIGAWCKRWPADGSERQPQWQTRRGWIALACALVLLFFVISLTDDLHAEVMVVEDAAGSKRHTCSVVCQSVHLPRTAASHHAVAVLPPSGFLFHQIFLEKVTREAPRATISALPLTPGRSPPSTSL
jgi:hypothetical protein